MSKTATEVRPNMFPFMRYHDAPAAIEWLVRAFGFEKKVAYPAPDGSIGHAELRYGPGVIMLGSCKEDKLNLTSPRDLPAVNQGTYIHVDAIDEHFERARGAGAEIVIELRNTDYGSREYVARDLEGQLWSFGTYYPE